MHVCVCVCVCVWVYRCVFVCACLCTVALLSAMLWIWNRAASICTAAIPPWPPHCAYCSVQLASLQKHRSMELVRVCQRGLSLPVLVPLFVWVHFSLVSFAIGFWETLCFPNHKKPSIALSRVTIIWFQLFFLQLIEKEMVIITFPQA